MSKLTVGVAVALLAAAGVYTYVEYFGDDEYTGARPDCAPAMFIGARGSSQANIASELGMGAEVFGVYAEAQKVSKVRIAGYGLDYPAAQALSNEYDGSVEDGADTLRGEVADLATRCKTSKVVIAGYSQGAQVAHRAFADLGAKSAKNVVAVILLADPTRKGSDPNMTDKVFKGVAGEDGALGAAALPAYAKGVVTSVCSAVDVVCNADPGNAAGGFSAHGVDYDPNTETSRYAATVTAQAFSKPVS